MKLLAVFLLALSCFHFSSAAIAENDIIYGINAADLSRGFNIRPFDAVKARLPELKQLGVTTIWLQPIFTSVNPDQGYETTNFFQIAPELGSDDEFLALITAAHSQGLKIILDVTLNHTSASHPLAVDVAKRGKASPYYNFYQHDINPNMAYAQDMHVKTVGQSPFVFYFWPSLYNLNYDNPVVQRYAMSILEFWIKKYDVDGFRLDAAWGPSSRWPDFYKTLSTRLRALKRHVLILAEDKAGYPEIYENTGHPHFAGSSIDLAYDWTRDRAWVSKWSFQEGDKPENTVFNEADPIKAAALFKNGLDQTTNSPVGVARYIEDNDTASFNSAHTEDQLKFASKVMLSLPDTPLLFYGQEVGAKHAMWQLPSFDPARSMRSYNPQLWDHYQRLITERRNVRPANEILKPVPPSISLEDAKVICHNLLAGVSSTTSIDFSSRSIETE